MLTNYCASLIRERKLIIIQNLKKNAYKGCLAIQLSEWRTLVGDILLTYKLEERGVVDRKGNEM